MADKAKRIRVSMTLPDGSRKFFDGRTKKEAEEKRDKAKILMAGGWSVGNKTTFNQMANLWLEEYMARKNLHDRTKETTEGIFRRYILPELGNMKITEIKPAHIDRMLLKISDLSKSTQRKVLTYTSAVFDKAIENEIIPRSPTFKKKPTADDPKKVKPLTDEQCKALLQATKGTRVYPFIIVCLFCGLRKGEALGLMWKDLDFENRVMKIERSIVYLDSNKKGEINTDLKTDSAHRMIPMSPEVCDVLRKEKARTESAYVFAMRNGNFLSEESFRSMWDLVRYRTIGGPATGHHVKATLDFDVHPHMLRHTCCTRWIEAGLTPKEAQYLMGHATPNITMGVYADFRAQQELQKTAEKMSSASLRLSV